MTGAYETVKAPDTETVTLTDVMNSLRGLSSSITDLKMRVDKVEGGAVKFTPMATPERVAQDISKPAMDLKGLTAGEQRFGGKTVACMVNGTLLPDFVPRYGEGTLVRINPKSDLGKRLEGQIVKVPVGRNQRQEMSALEGVGRVEGLHYVDKNHETKYRVVFPGLTGVRGDGYRESELVAV